MSGEAELQTKKGRLHRRPGETLNVTSL